MLHGWIWYICCYVGNKALLQCLCNYWEEWYGPVFGTLVCVFIGFWDRDYVSQLPGVRYYVFVKSILNIRVRNARPRVPMCLGVCICHLAFLLSRESIGVADSSHTNKYLQPAPDQHNFRPDHICRDRRMSVMLMTQPCVPQESRGYYKPQPFIDNCIF